MNYAYPSRTVLSTQRITIESDEVADNGELFQRKSTREIASYLTPYPAESDTDFLNRHRRACYMNLCKTVVDNYANAVAGSVHRDLGDLEPYLKNVDYEGTSYDEFIKKLTRDVATYGFCAVFIDTPETVDVSTLEAQRVQGIGPKSFVINPTQIAWLVIDSKTHKLMEFAYVDPGFFSSELNPQGTIVQVNIMNASGFHIREGMYSPNESLVIAAQKFAVVQGSEVQLPAVLGGELPIVWAFYEKKSDSLMPMGLSLVDYMADVCKKIYNLNSDIENIHRKSAFAMLAIPSRLSTLDPKSIRQIGPGNAFVYDAESGSPTWTAPPSDPTQEIREQIKFDMESGYRSVGLEVAWAQSTSAQSGVSLRIKARDFDSRAKMFASNMHKTEEKILALFALLLGGAVKSVPSITYPTVFTLPDPSEDIDNTLKVFGLNLELGETAMLTGFEKLFTAAWAPQPDKLNKMLDEQKLLLESGRSAFEQQNALQVQALQQKLGGGSSTPPPVSQNETAPPSSEPTPSDGATPPNKDGA